MSIRRDWRIAIYIRTNRYRNLGGGCITGGVLYHIAEGIPAYVIGGRRIDQIIAITSDRTIIAGRRIKGLERQAIAIRITIIRQYINRDRLTRCGHLGIIDRNR